MLHSQEIDSKKKFHLPTEVRSLFSKIAPYYDLINDIQSLGLHRLWKHRLITSLEIQPHQKIIDLACGSGDLTFRAIQEEPLAHVFGGDYTFPMLRIAIKRARHFPLQVQGWIQLDALRLPFKEKSVDGVIISYGLRNFEDPIQALQKIFKLIKPHGKIAILEFGKPKHFLFKKIYFFSLKLIQPFLGWLFFKDSKTYHYIYESLLRYPSQEEISKILHSLGFQKIRCRNFVGGCMSLHLAVKPAST